MTETEWLKCSDPTLMLKHLAETVSERKLLLFACACQRRVLSLREPESVGRNLVEALEPFADGLIERRELPDSLRDSTGQDIAIISCRDAAFSSERMGLLIGSAELEAQSSLVRDIFGNPFQPLMAEESWLTPSVVNLAQSIYDKRAFDRLPGLADAIEDAGCHEAPILDHCRSKEQHVRGCWVLDLILGRQ